MSVCGPHPRLLPVLLVLLLVCLQLSLQGAEAKKKVKKTKPATVPTTVAVDVDAQPPPLALQSDVLFNGTAEAAIEHGSEQQAMQWTTNATSANTSTSSSATSAPLTNASSRSSPTELFSDSTPTPSASSALLYPLVALGAVASSLGLAYLWYRFIRTNSSAPPPAFDSIPLLRLLPPNHPAGRAQGSEWAVEQLRWDDDGDSAHDFLGPFAFASSGNATGGDSGQTEVTEEKLMHEPAAGGANKNHAKRARKKA